MPVPHRHGDCYEIALVFEQKEQDDEDRNLSQKSETHDKYVDNVEMICRAYKNAMEKLEKYKAEEAIVSKLKENYTSFIDRFSEYTGHEYLKHRINNNHSFGTAKDYSYCAEDIKSSNRIPNTPSRKDGNVFLRFFRIVGSALSDMFDEIYFDSETVIKFLLTVASVVLLFITANKIKNDDSIGNIIFFGISSIICIVGTCQAFDWAEEIPILFRTLIWIVLAYFVIFDFGFGLELVWRIVMGLILFILSYKIFDEIV